MSTILLLSAYLAQAVLAQYPASDCTSFTSNGIAASTFQYYRFYDFRNLKPTTYSNTTSTDAASSARSKVTKDDSWTEDWFIRDYPRNSPGGTSIPVNFTTSHVSISSSSSSPKKQHTKYTNTNTTSKLNRPHQKEHLLPNPLHNPPHPPKPTRRRNNIHRTQPNPRLHPRPHPNPRFPGRHRRNIHLQKRHPRSRHRNLHPRPHKQNPILQSTRRFRGSGVDTDTGCNE